MRRGCCTTFPFPTFTSPTRSRRPSRSTSGGARPTVPASSGQSSAYSPILLSTPQVLDAAVQTINALHQTLPFDFGLSLGDACNNTQYNELRWFLDTIDGKVITPSSGAHLGASSIDYQKPFQAAGLNPQLRWYQVMGNHDQFWMGCAFEDTKTQNAHVGDTILNISDDGDPPPEAIQQKGAYMGVLDGWTPYGDIWSEPDPRPTSTRPPKVVADANRHSLSTTDVDHAELDEGILQHHDQPGRARLHAEQSRPGLGLLQLRAQVRYSDQDHRAGRHGEGAGPGRLRRRRARRSRAISGWSMN